MGPELSRRLGQAIGAHRVLPSEVATIVAVVIDADVWADMPASVRTLVEEIENRPDVQAEVLATVASGHVATFHLPGRHDQRDHGRWAKYGTKAFNRRGDAVAGIAVRSDLAVRELSGGAQATTTRETTPRPDGRMIVRKKFKGRYKNARDEADSEILSARLLDAAGVHAPAMHRVSDTELAMEFMDATVGSEVVLNDGAAEADRLRDSNEGRLLGLVDVITRNADRHSGNWMRHSDGTVVAIDGGLAFSAGGPYYDARWGRYIQESGASPEHIALLKKQLKKLKPEFIKAGRLGWWEQTWVNLEDVEVRSQEIQSPPGPPDNDSRGAVAAGATFHLPGHHDQREHGRRLGGIDLDLSDAGRDAVQWQPNLEPVEDMVRTVDSGAVDSESLSGGQFGDVERVTFGNGKTLIAKTVYDAEDVFGDADIGDATRQADAEQSAAMLGTAIGAPVPRALRAADNAVWLDQMGGETVAAMMERDQTAAVEAFDDSADTDGGMRLGLFDLLTDSWDRRNPSNVLIQADGSPAGIDHSFSWPSEDMASQMDGGLPPLRRHLSPYAIAYCTFDDNGEVAGFDGSDLHPDDVAWLRDRLDALKNDFEAIDRLDWWQFAVDRLNALGAVASGTTRRFGQE